MFLAAGVAHMARQSIGYAAQFFMTVTFPCSRLPLTAITWTDRITGSPHGTHENPYSSASTRDFLACQSTPKTQAISSLEEDFCSPRCLTDSECFCIFHYPRAQASL